MKRFLCFLKKNFQFLLTVFPLISENSLWHAVMLVLARHRSMSNVDGFQRSAPHGSNRSTCRGAVGKEPFNGQEEEGRQEEGRQEEGG